jgi:hypothetical protein
MGHRVINLQGRRVLCLGFIHICKEPCCENTNLTGNTSYVRRTLWAIWPTKIEVAIYKSMTNALNIWRRWNTRKTTYQPFDVCSLFMGAGVSIVSLVDLRFFYRSKCIHTLIWERVYRSLIHAVSSCIYNPTQFIEIHWKITSTNACAFLIEKSLTKNCCWICLTFWHRNLTFKF